MESNFTPICEWLDTVDNGCPESEYLYGLGLVLFVIGRWTHLDTLNSICHLSDHVWSWLRSVWRISWWILEEILRYIILSYAKRRIEDLIFPFMSFMQSKKRTGPRTEPCGTPDVTSVLSDRAPLTETLCLRLDRKDLSQF